MTWVPRLEELHMVHLWMHGCLLDCLVPGWHYPVTCSPRPARHNYHWYLPQSLLNRCSLTSKIWRKNNQRHQCRVVILNVRVARQGCIVQQLVLKFKQKFWLALSDQNRAYNGWIQVCFLFLFLFQLLWTPNLYVHMSHENYRQIIRMI